MIIYVLNIHKGTTAVPKGTKSVLFSVGQGRDLNLCRQGSLQPSCEKKTPHMHRQAHKLVLSGSPTMKFETHTHTLSSAKAWTLWYFPPACPVSLVLLYQSVLTKRRKPKLKTPNIFGCFSPDVSL